MTEVQETVALFLVRSYRALMQSGVEADVRLTHDRDHNRFSIHVIGVGVDIQTELHDTPDQCWDSFIHAYAQQEATPKPGLEGAGVEDE